MIHLMCRHTAHPRRMHPFSSPNKITSGLEEERYLLFFSHLFLTLVSRLLHSAADLVLNGYVQPSWTHFSALTTNLASLKVGLTVPILHCGLNPVFSGLLQQSQFTVPLSSSLLPGPCSSTNFFLCKCSQTNCSNQKEKEKRPPLSHSNLVSHCSSL